MNNSVFITCALTGAGDTYGKSPHLPVTPKEIADSGLEAAAAALRASTTQTVVPVQIDTGDDAAVRAAVGVAAVTLAGTVPPIFQTFSTQPLRT